ncbi:MAG TPA: YciI family protein [Cyclobacteriaceae bacterium]|jgi:hypothetical protein|nr:YciI family protein [Cyclobacteriaceae bacterium]
MQEFMLLVRNEGERLAALTSEKRLEFVKKCEVYISDLKKKGKLIAAQPLIREGKIISGTPAAWKEDNVNEKKEIQVGYYHILAENIDDAIAIAKGNPEFEYTPTAKVEVRPIKAQEEKTGFVYPK